jgi:hypothetical protein
VRPVSSFEELPLVLTLEEVRQVVRKGRRQMYEMVRKGIIKPLPGCGRSLRFSRESIQRFLSEGSEQSRPRLEIREGGASS